MRKRIALLLVALFVLAGWPGVGVARDTALSIARDKLNAQGLESNDEIYQSYVDLSDTHNGTVSSVTYTGALQTMTTNTYSVQSQVYTVAMDKLTRYVFKLINAYRPDTELSITGISGDNMTTRIYVYGAMKDEAMWAVVNGLPDCLNNEPVYSGRGDSSSSTWVEQYSPEQIAETIATATFSVSSTTLTVSSSSTSETTTIEMDVAPEIVGDRTFVPVRYLAYALGVPESGVTWDDATNSVTITKDETIISLTISNTTETVNGEPIQMDAAPYIKEIDTGGRTMLPARWVAEPLGATVTWDQEKQQMKIELPQPPEPKQEQAQ